MTIQGLSKRDEISRARLQRDTRTLGERTLAALRSLPAIGMVYFLLIGFIVMFPAMFDLGLVIGLAFSIIPLTNESDLPFRMRRSLGGVDPKDLSPGSKKPQRARGIFFLGNRQEDNAEIWAGNEDMRTHVFQLGSTGAGKTEALIGLFINTLNQSSGVAYLDGKADVKLWGQFFSGARAYGREDDVRVLNYMTGNADTTQRRADKLSNTTNPFTTGNAESNTQLLVDLMDAAGSGGDMWKGRAISWLSSLMPPLHELRDQGFLNLHVGLIRDTAPPLQYFKLMEHPNLSQRSRDGMLAFLSTVPGFNPNKKPDQQSSSFLDQYGFQTMQFTRILGSLADTYGHIYSTAAGEVIYRDIVLNRRLLLVMLPALEKSRPELGNLGKINVAAMKSMMGTELGGRLEGTKRDLLDARSTNAPMPFVAIFDEFGYFMPDGAALMWAQARGLGFCLVAAGQDLQAFFRTSREETMAIVANCNIKIVGKLEDPDATYEMVRKMAGEANVAENEGYDLNTEGMGGFRPRLGARVTRADRISLQDLKNQVEGEIHIFVKADIIRGRTFYAAPKLAKEFRLNHFIKVLPPDADAIRARRLDVRGILESLTVEPFSGLEQVNDRFAVLPSLTSDERLVRYSTNKQGGERGIFLLMHLCMAPDSSGASESGASSGAGGLAHKPVDEPQQEGIVLAAPESSPDASVTDQLASMLGVADSSGVDSITAVPITPVAPLAGNSPAEIETFDGGKLEATNVFESTLTKPSLVEQMQVIAAAALPLVHGLFDVNTTGSKGTQSDTEVGSLDRAETEAALHRIALGLGSEPEKAPAIAEGIIDAAIHGTEYPLPPKPAATPDKQETMEGVMSDLEALMTGPGGQG